MLDTLQSMLTRANQMLEWIPGNVAGMAVLGLAALFALLVHGIASRLVRMIVRRRSPYLAGILANTPHLTRLAILIVAMMLVLPAAPFDPAVARGLTHVLLVGGIVVAGWLAIAAIHTFADLYLLRFRLDVADNLLARKHVTQVRVLRRVVDTLVVIVTTAAAMMTFEPVRQYGVSLFASAGVAGLVVGFAARPVLSNLIAGIQLAVTQPIRIDDAVVVENEFGNIEEITSTYIVLRLWDLRRMIVPLSYFIEKPFQNWTRESTTLIGAVTINVDYTTPVAVLRAKAEELVRTSALWDGNVLKLQVTDAGEWTMQLRVIASARSAGDAFDLRCEIRERLIDYLQREHPGSLPRRRTETLTAAQEQSRPA